jgi:hypothetical protein
MWPTKPGEPLAQNAFPELSYGARESHAASNETLTS